MVSTAESVEIISVDTATAACDGGGGALGHPKVYLNLGSDGEVDCPYCGRRFVLSGAAGKGGGH